MASVFTSSGIAKGFAAASIVAVVGSTPSAAQVNWDTTTAAIKYLQYDLPYYKLPVVSFTNSKYSRPQHRLAFRRYEGLYNYVPHSVADAPSMPGTAAIPFIGYDLTPY
jgi:hypothetical protein